VCPTMKTKSKGIELAKKACRSSPNSHTPNLKKPCLESLKGFSLLIRLGVTSYSFKMVHMEEWKVAKDFS